jgi:hypothetical protein
MPTICGKLEQDILFDCNFPEQGGADEELLLINHEDLDRTQGDNGFLLNVLNPLIIEAVYLKVGAKANAVKGKRNPNAIVSTYTVQDFSSGWQHQVMFPAYEVSPATVRALKGLENSKVLAILKTNQVNSAGNNQYKMVGKQVGLYLSEATYNSNENQGVTMITLAPDGDLLEPNKVDFLFNTDLATTAALYDSLKEVVPTPP